MWRTARKVLRHCPSRPFPGRRCAGALRAGTPLRLEEHTLPAPGEGEILVRNEYATLCRSDLSTYAGRRVEKTPTILGHETVGRVAALGSPLSDLSGRPLRVGDRVTWAIYAADPSGAMARRGIPQKSPDLFKYGHERLTPESSWHGGLAEYTLLRRFTPVLVLSEAVPLPAAAILNCAVATVAAGEVRPGAMAADAAMDFCGRPEAMEQTLEALAVGGTAVWVGGVCPQRPVSVDGERVVRRLLSVRGLHNYNAADFSAAVSFMERCHGRYPFAALVRDSFPLEEAEAAFRCALERNPYRVGIHFKTSRP